MMEGLRQASAWKGPLFAAFFLLLLRFSHGATDESSCVDLPTAEKPSNPAHSGPCNNLPSVSDWDAAHQLEKQDFRQWNFVDRNSGQRQLQQAPGNLLPTDPLTPVNTTVNTTVRVDPAIIPETPALLPVNVPTASALLPVNPVTVPANPGLVPALVNETGSPVTADNPLLANASNLVPEYNLTENFLKLNITKLPKKFNLTQILPALLPTLNLTALYLALNITLNTTKLNITYPPPPPAYLCYGIEVEYLIVGNMTKTQFGSLPAFLYTAQFKVQNFGKWAIRNWGVRFQFRNQDVLNNGNDLLPPLGVTLPAASNLLLLQPSLERQALQTAYLSGYDSAQYTFTTTIEGTEIGANTTLGALPIGMEFLSPGVICDPINLRLVNGTNSTDGIAADPTLETIRHIRTCCRQAFLPPVPENTTAPALPPPAPTTGVQITWDVLKSDTQVYEAMVRIQNQQALRPIGGDGWSLGFTLQQNEVIWSIVGGQVVYRGDCLAYAGTTYADVGTAVACTATPTIRDISSRNGSLTSYAVKTFTAGANLTMSLGRSTDFFGAKNLAPPQNWTIGVPGYDCAPPVRAEPSLFPLNNYSITTYPALATYTVQCALTPDALASTTCSVSMSAFWNKTITTVGSCACGCTEYQYAQGCDPTQPAPAGAAAAIDLGPTTDKKAVQIPGGEQACGDGCGTSIHLDLVQTFKGGWVMKVAIANQSPRDVKDWLLALQFPYLNNLEHVFTVDNLTTADNELLLFGFSFYNNYLLGETGNIGAELQFNDSGILGGTAKRVPRGVFPTQVMFMGEVCAMPTDLPWKASRGDRLAAPLLFVVAILAGFLLL